MNPNYYKKKFHNYIKFFFVFCLNIRMINLSLNESKLIAQNRSISDYENKSGKDLRHLVNQNQYQNQN